jgi:four helix bundle protein
MENGHARSPQTLDLLRDFCELCGSDDKLLFLNIAQESLEESRHSLILTRDLAYGDEAELRSLLSEVSKLLAAYSKAILNSGS